MCTCLRAGFLMTLPTEWIHFDNTTIEVAQLTLVCASVRARFMKRFKFGRLRASLLAKDKGDSETSYKSKNEKHKGFLMSPPTEWIDFVLC